MRRETILLVCGLLVFATPFLGVPESWKVVLLFVLGASIVFISFMYRLTSREEERTDEDLVYMEHEPGLSERGVHGL